MEIFNCKCQMILYNPCTLGCGHTLCESCFEKVEYCEICGSEPSSREFHLNVALAGNLERWFPSQYRSAELKKKAKMLIKEEKYQNALEVLEQSIKLVGKDSISLCLRSETNLKLRNTKQAYRDAVSSSKLCKENGEAHFMLGVVCTALNRLDSAVEAYQKCLECSSADASLYSQVCENLDELLSVSLGEEIEVSDEDDDEYEFNREADFDCDCDCNKLSKPNENSDLISVQDSRKRILSDKCPRFCGVTAKRDKIVTNSEAGLFSANMSSNSRIGPLLPSRKIPPAIETSKNWKCDKKSSELIVAQAETPQLEDFECKLCFNLFLQPITTPCGHVFCRICLERCVDLSQSCPNCRSRLEFNESSVGNVTVIIDQAAELYFPEEVRERNSKYQEELKEKSRVGIDEDIQVPIFSSILTFPTIQSQFHIFEQRYRLMVRECLESGSKRFGVCMSNKEGEHSNYGTIVEVKHCQTLPDGRSIIDVVGEKRFKVSNSNGVNGIPHGKVEYFADDLGLYRTDVQKEQLANKCMAVYNHLNDYIGKLHPTERECIFSALGPIPQIEPNAWELANGMSWVWWATAALPLGDKVKMLLFKSHSLLERVTILHRFLKLLSKVYTNSPALVQPGSQVIS